MRMFKRYVKMPTVLVVDDDPDTHTVVRQILESHGFSTISAWDGANAMAVLKNLDQLPALIIFDLRMPKMNGWRLVYTLSNDARWTSMPRLAMSAVPGELNLGATPVLRKPFRAEQLIAAVREVLPN
jgi:CheY-like chemotaxis protein